MQRFFLLMICLLPLLGIHAQDFTVTGKVVDNTGLEVIGANISIKGSAGVGTITNIDGQSCQGCAYHLLYRDENTRNSNKRTKTNQCDFARRQQGAG